jgi:CRISPR-associated protein (TIGR03984 family)
MSIALLIYTRLELALANTLRAFTPFVGSQSATAILYSPKRCCLATFSAGALHGPDGQPLDIGAVFEARVFNETAELRWLNDPGPDQRHRAAILTEQDHSSALGDWQRPERPADVIEKLSQTYLLWGEGTGRPIGNGWSELATARIGALLVPASNLGKKQRVLLHTVEYIVEAEHRNAIVLDERLLKLEVAHG